MENSISLNKTMRASPTVTFPGTLNTNITAFSNGASQYNNKYYSILNYR
jgi:hypothetical protein